MVSVEPAGKAMCQTWTTIHSSAVWINVKFLPAEVGITFCFQNFDHSQPIEANRDYKGQ